VDGIFLGEGSKKKNICLGLVVMTDLSPNPSPARGGEQEGDKFYLPIA